MKTIINYCKAHITSIIIAGLIIIALIFAFTAKYYHAQAIAEKNQRLVAEAEKANFSVPVIKTIKDVNGNQHYQAPANANTFTRQTFDKGHTLPTVADTTAKILGIQRDRISYLERVSVVISDSLKAAKFLITKQNQKIAYYQNANWKLAYHYPASADTADHGYFDYHGNIQLNHTQYYKNKFLWIKYNPVIDLYANDPHASINGYQTLTIAPTPSPFTFKAQVKAIYDFSTGTVFPASKIELGIGKFEFAGGYYYNIKRQAFRPTVSAAYNLLNFR